MQAHYLGDARQALELSTAGYDTAVACGSPALAAKCAGGQGIAHALARDGRASAQACVLAENLLDRDSRTGERTWFLPFTTDLMTVCRLHMAGDLGQTAEVQRIAPVALTLSRASARRQVLYTSTLAASHLPAASNPGSDIDRACELLAQVLPSLNSLHSARGLERFNAVRRALAAHANRPSVQDFEDRYRSTITAASPRVGTARHDQQS